MYAADRFEYRTKQDGSSRSRVIALDGGVTTRDRLFDLFATVLEFPSYCLSDLGWLSADEVIIDHDEMPRLEPRALRLYLESLQDVLARGERASSRRIRVVFRPQHRDSVESALQHLD